MSSKIAIYQAQHRFSFFGGVLGIVVFLVAGLRLSLIYGSFAGGVLAHGLLGHATESMPYRSIVGFGVLVMCLSMGALFTVFGAVLGTALFGVTRFFARKPHGGHASGTEHPKA